MTDNNVEAPAPSVAAPAADAPSSPAPARGSYFDEGPLVPVLIFGAIAMLAFGGFVVSRQAAAYMKADVAKGVAYGGAITAHVLVFAAVIAAAVLWNSFEEEAAKFVTALGVIAAVAFALLPPIVADSGWVTVVLTAVMTLVFDGLVAVLLAVPIRALDD